MDMGRSPDWSELPPELLELVLSKLQFIDVFRFKGVCSSFRLAAKVRSSVALLLMHQSTQDNGEDHDFRRKLGKTVRFLSPQDMNAVIYSPERKKSLERLLDKGRCVGSSHGWLVVLDKEAHLFLVNPFSGAEIELPKELPLIQKAILTANPSYAEDYKVFLICGCCRIVFCCRGDRIWRTLSSPEHIYDVDFHNGRLYAIQRDLPPDAIYDAIYHIPNRIRTWDLSSTLEVPQECGCIVISDFVKQLRNKFHGHGHGIRYYLVSSSDELFFVVRIIRANADPWASRTVGFEIYKVERQYGKEFVRVESLPGQAMFLGGNHGMVISVQEYDNRLNENSIYFTYSYDDAFFDSFTYDIGIYNLENRSVNLLCDVQKKKPMPFWVFTSQK